MFGLFRKKTLEEKRAIVKEHARKNELTGEFASMVYFEISVYFGWTDAANSFIREYLRESSESVSILR